MQLVEQHVIDRNDPRYAIIDEAAFKSKNLYNAALYEIRQSFIHTSVYLDYHEMHQRMQSREAFKALPAKVSQQVLILLHKNWISFFEALQAYKEDPSRFTGRPKLPQYKHKTEGRNILVYTIQALSQPGMRDGLIRPSGLPITIASEHTVVDQVRIVPRHGYYVVEVVYSKEPVQAKVDPSFCVGTLWKQEASMGKRNNQNFVFIPLARFIDMLTYKATLVGIQVEVREESYTSKASFLDLDPIPTYKPDDEEQQHVFGGKRIGRRNRLYRTKDGRKICADVNGAYNILRKSRPDAFSEAKGVAGYVVHPVRLAV